MSKMPVSGQTPDTDGPMMRLHDDEMRRYQTQYGFSQEQITQFLDAFSVFDKNRDRVISQHELASVLASLGQIPSDQQLVTLIHRVDSQNSGTISFERFVSLMAQRFSGCDHDDAELRDVFDVFDINTDGRITADELAEILHRLGEDMTESEVCDMIKEADLNGDGAIDFTEFKAILNAK